MTNETNTTLLAAAVAIDEHCALDDDGVRLYRPETLRPLLDELRVAIASAKGGQ